jgi:hypothetical protein
VNLCGCASPRWRRPWRDGDRTAGKGATPALRTAGLRLAVAVVDGLNPLDRNAATVHAEGWRLFDRCIKVRRGGALRGVWRGAFQSLHL